MRSYAPACNVGIRSHSQCAVHSAADLKPPLSLLSTDYSLGTHDSAMHSLRLFIFAPNCRQLCSKQYSIDLQLALYLQWRDRHATNRFANDSSADGCIRCINNNCWLIASSVLGYWRCNEGDRRQLWDDLFAFVRLFGMEPPEFPDTSKLILRRPLLVASRAVKS